MNLSTPLRIRLNSGADIAYSDSGNPDKPVIIFIHGLSCYSMFWQPLTRFLEKDHRCIALDLPGHGYTEMPSGWKITLQDCSLLLYEFTQMLGLDKFILCGHSLGGQIAVRFDGDYPGHVIKLLLLSPAGLETFTDSERSYIESLESFSRFTWPVIGNQLWMLMKGTAPALIEHAESLNRRRKESNHMYTRAMLTEPVFHFYKLRPTLKLVIFGTQDELIPNPFLQRGATETYMKEACRGINSVTLKFLPGGHFVHLASAKKVAEMIREFIT